MLKISGLSKVYPTGTVALKNIDFTVGEPEVVAIIGPSGCGKSSLLRLFNRMNDLIPGVRVEGTVQLDGEPIYSLTVDVADLRKRVGMVFQRPNPFPMSVYENVTLGPKRHGQMNRMELNRIVETSLRRATLWDEVKDNLNQPALALSSGQQQRLCMARVLAVEPEVILMDEPCSSLDPEATLKIEDLMRQLAANYAIVIVTHNMQQAARSSVMTPFMMKAADSSG